nr:hypothetical protein [Tanacetum cinerariifolium]
PRVAGLSWGSWGIMGKSGGLWWNGAGSGKEGSGEMAGKLGWPPPSVGMVLQIVCLTKVSLVLEVSTSAGGITRVCVPRSLSWRKSLDNVENVGFDPVKCYLYPSFIEGHIAKGVGLRVENSHTGNHREDDFTPLETIQRFLGVIGSRSLSSSEGRHSSRIGGGFLGLTAYYKRFIKGYAAITHPLTKLMKKNAFNWSTEAQTAFTKLRGHDQITTPSQMKWLPKLMGFDFEITYKKSSDNGAVDALSRVNTGGQLLPMVLTFMTTDLLSKIVQSWDNDPILQTMIQNLKAVFRIQGYCYRRKMKKQVKEFVTLCAVCQRSKPDLSSYPGLLQPLPIPTLIWSEISMDFVEGLSSSNGKTRIMVVVDRLTKTTPCEAVYGQPPSSHILYSPGQSNVDSVDMSLSAREVIVKMLQFHLEKAQARMKAATYLHRTDRSFEEGQWVWLMLDYGSRIARIRYEYV